MTPLEWIISTSPVDYEDASLWMQQRVIEIQRGHAAECVWLLEHPPLYTGGTSAKKDDLLHPQFPIFETGRGGQYTYHGPGQRICYVMLDLSRRDKDLRRYVLMLEEWGIQTLRAIGIESSRSPAGVGLWVTSSSSEQPTYSKIAAIGVRISKWVTSHGIAFNLSTDLSHYNGIVPCGLKHYGVTSVTALGHTITMREFDKVLKTTFQTIPFFNPIISSLDEASL